MATDLQSPFDLQQTLEIGTTITILVKIHQTEGYKTPAQKMSATHTQ